MKRKTTLFGIRRSKLIMPLSADGSLPTYGSLPTDGNKRSVSPVDYNNMLSYEEQQEQKKISKMFDINPTSAFPPNDLYCSAPSCNTHGLFTCAYCSKNFCLKHKITINIGKYGDQYVCGECFHNNDHAKLAYDLEYAFLIKEKNSWKQKLIRFCSFEWIRGKREYD